MKLNPGSEEALDHGCTCPILDNNHGYCPPFGEDGWWINENCPLHSAVAKETAHG